ncbi:YadA-like family protein [Lysobacter arenosi]|uniref:YadA-like family protein n=1 Tax=Lysobacter arenosi TaxID=2795387 RepID=A0ABX7R9L6_9GAMM|nr:YadA-like family protein [Lysobacter arenosi]QSX74102.1 YadA-like family protein [Lysobacter arenosi]
MSKINSRRNNWPALNSIALSVGLALLSPAAFAADSIAIGTGSQAPIDAAIAIGYDSKSLGTDTIAIGTLAEASNDSSMALGVSSEATGDFSIALGPVSTASGEASIAIGMYSQATADSSVALGDHSIADRANSVSVGAAGAERQITNVAAGTQATDAVNLSQLNDLQASVDDNSRYFKAGGVNDGSDDAAVSGVQSVAIGANAIGADNLAVAVGAGSMSSQASVAAGAASLAAGESSVAVGSYSEAATEGSVAVGADSHALADNSVALGLQSVADRANTVSVGAAGAERQITNVAAGSEDTDAVNVAQLKQAGLVDGTGTSLDAVVYDAGSAKGQVTLGGGVAGTLVTNVRDGAIASGSRDAVNGGQIAALRDSLNGAISNIDNRVTTIEANGGGKGAPDFVAANGTPTPAAVPANAGSTPGVALGYNTDASGAGASAIGDSAKAAGSDAVAIGNKASAAASNSVALGNNSVADRANAVSVGSAGHERQVTNVAAGVNATDAVNVQQLKAGNAQTLSSANAYTDSRFQGLSDEFSGLRDDVGYRLGKLDDRIDRQGAMNSAMMNMAINAAHSRSPRGRIGVGAGWQNGESALSLGYSKEINDRASISIGGAFSSGDQSAGIGFGIDL